MNYLRYMGRQPHALNLLESIARIDTELEHEAASNLTNEVMIEKWWSRARGLDTDCPGYWLLLARLAEAALLCAGNYADSCEYQAAGDLLVNPREILVRRRHDGRSTAKSRHGRLSEQFGLEGPGYHHAMKRFSAGVRLEVSRAPLLPHMTRVLRSSGFISAAYLQRLETGQRRVADALAFLAAWQVFDSMELTERLQAVSLHERRFAESRLCRFNDRIFHQIGMSLHQSLKEPDCQSPFLAADRTDRNEVFLQASPPGRTAAGSRT